MDGERQMTRKNPPGGRVFFLEENGGRRRNRTADTKIFSLLLYRLSYPAKRRGGEEGRLGALSQWVFLGKMTRWSNLGKAEGEVSFNIKAQRKRQVRKGNFIRVYSWSADSHSQLISSVVW